MPTIASGASSAVLLAALALPAQAPQTWVQLDPEHAPSPRLQHAMAYDVARGVSVLFGGGSGSTVGMRDTWEWDGTDWTQRHPVHAPPGRNMHAMAYDIHRQRTVLFGGRDPSGELGDTWEWDGADWTRIRPRRAPAPRSAHGMAYDFARRCVVLVGGRCGPITLHEDVWEWDGTAWRDITPNPMPQRREARVAYDLARQRTVLFGGGDGAVRFNDTWEWDGRQFVGLQPTPRPKVRSEHGLVYDLGLAKTVLFGGSSEGSDLPDETWGWDGVDWAQVPTVVSPPGRRFPGMVHDLARQRTVMFGGQSGGVALGDTWELGVFATPSYTTFGQGCGSAARGWRAPVLGHTGTPVTGQSFDLHLDNRPAGHVGVVLCFGLSNARWGSATLPMSLGPLAPGCSILVSGDLMQGVPVPSTGARLTVPVAIPDAPALWGATFHNQFYVFDAAASPPVIVVSNAGTGTIGDD